MAEALLKSSDSFPLNDSRTLKAMPRTSEEAVTTKETKELAERIVKLRKERGITQVELAVHLSVTQPMVSRFEQGDFRISSDMVTKLAKLFAVSADELLGLKSNLKDEPLSVPRRWVKRISKIDQMAKRDQDALARIIDAFFSKQNSKAS